MGGTSGGLSAFQPPDYLNQPARSMYPSTEGDPDSVRDRTRLSLLPRPLRGKLAENRKKGHRRVCSEGSRARLSQEPRGRLYFKPACASGLDGDSQ
jgi:hypothetical protein